LGWRAWTTKEDGDQAQKSRTAVQLERPNAYQLLLHHLKGYNRLKAITPIAEITQFGHLIQTMH
jgi:hypothetical protein